MIFDFGGTTVKYACSDGEGRFRMEGAFATPKELGHMIQEMQQAYTSCFKEEKAAGIALSLPGAVHPMEGLVEGISAIPYIHHRPLREEISRAFQGISVSMENDACCAALGELWKGAGKGKKNLIFVVIGTGIGGAILVDGKLYHGNNYTSGEFGNYLLKKEDWGWCKWGDYTIVHQCEKYEKQTHKKVDGKELLQLAANQDNTAIGLTEEFYEVMAAGIYNLQFAFDPETVILGGGVSEAAGVIPKIREKIDDLARGRDFACICPSILKAEHGNRANLLGALRWHLDLFEG